MLDLLRCRGVATTWGLPDLEPEGDRSRTVEKIKGLKFDVWTQLDEVVGDGKFKGLSIYLFRRCTHPAVLDFG